MIYFFGVILYIETKTTLKMRGLNKKLIEVYTKEDPSPFSFSKEWFRQNRENEKKKSEWIDKQSMYFFF